MIEPSTSNNYRTNESNLYLVSSFYLTHIWGVVDREFIHSPKSINPKVNAIVRLGFEVAYIGGAVQQISHYKTELPPCSNRFVKDVNTLCTVPSPVISTKCSYHFVGRTVNSVIIL